MTHLSHVAVRESAFMDCWYVEIITSEGIIAYSNECPYVTNTISRYQMQWEFGSFDSAKRKSAELCAKYGIPRIIRDPSDRDVKFLRFGYHFMHLKNQMYLVWPHINGSPIAEFRDSYWYVNGEKIDVYPTYFAELPKGPLP